MATEPIDPLHALAKKNEIEHRKLVYENDQQIMQPINIYEYMCVADFGDKQGYTDQKIKVNKLPTKEIDDLTIVDTDWVRSRYIIPTSDLDQIDAMNRYYTSASWKWQSTQMGGHPSINPKPQFTRTADVKPRFISTRQIFNNVTKYESHRLGMGRYYSEAIDDNEEKVYLQFGVPKFTSLIMFYLRAVNYSDSVMANRGKLPLGYEVGRFIGAYAAFCAFPWTSIIIFIGKGVMDVIMGRKMDYYYLNPSMHAYWGTVSEILNHMAIELGVLKPESIDGKIKADKIGQPLRMDQNATNELARLLPGIISPNTNYLDVYAITAKPQVIANKVSKAEYELMKEGNIEQKMEVALEGAYYEPAGGGKQKLKNVPDIQPTVGAMVNNALSMSNLIKLFTKKNGLFGDKVDVEEATDPAASDTDSQVSKQTINGQEQGVYDKKYDGEGNARYPKLNQSEGGWWDIYGEVIDSSVRDGNAYLVLTVNYSGAQGESFNNSVSDIEASGMLKGVPSAVRNLKFNLAGGNAIPGLSDVLGLVKDTAIGLLDGFSFGLAGTVAALLGGAYIHLPKKWDDSDMSFPSISYTIQLRSPYGHPFAQLQNIYLPLACLLAGTLPLATGGSSYTSPYICSLFNKGQQITSLGMITSLSITRGTTNLGFDQKRRPLGIDVTFTVTDFSNLVTAPVNTSVFDLSQYSINPNAESSIGKYIGVMCGRDLYSQVYAVPRSKQKFSMLGMNVSKWLSPARWGSATGDLIHPVISPFVSPRAMDPSELNQQNQRTNYKYS